MRANVSIQNLTRRKSVPRFAYTHIVEKMLPGWEISLAFVTPTQAKALNTKLRGKTYIPNVLSYKVGAKSGEIIICMREAELQAASYSMTADTFVLYLFIHGVLHIKGWPHGAKMEKCEQLLLAEFAKVELRKPPHGTTHRNRNRHRHLPSKGSRRRGSRG